MHNAPQVRGPTFAYQPLSSPKALHVVIIYDQPPPTFLTIPLLKRTDWSSTTCIPSFLEFTCIV